MDNSPASPAPTPPPAPPAAGALLIQPVAYLKTPFPEKFGVPRQGGQVAAAEARVVFLPAFAQPDFVRGLEGFSHVWLITHFHHNPPWAGAATVRPPRLGGNERRGVFATRSPQRPNGLGLSLVRLLAIELAPTLALRVAGIDAVDFTPVFDVKPYLPWCEALPEAQADWAQAAPAPRPAPAVVIPAEIAAQIATTPGGPAALTLIRELLRYDWQPAYQAEPGRTYGMSVAGWNIRWRTLAVGGVEVIEAVPLARPAPCL